MEKWARSLVVGDFGEPSDKLREEMTSVRNSSLESGLAEGYHRSTHYSLERAAASRTPWVLASTRYEQNIKICDTFVEDYGEYGRDVFRFEWQNFKRLLRPTKRREFIPVKVRDQPFFEQVYCLSPPDPAWSNLVGTVGSRSGPPPPDDSVTKMRTEYLKTVIAADNYYSVDLTEAQLAEDGSAVEYEVKTYFQVIHLYKDGHRPTVVQTHDDDELLQRGAACAVNIQYLEPWVDGQFYFDAEPLLCNILDLAPFPKLQHTLLTYTHCAAEEQGCILLSEPKQAVPTMPLTDADCPTLTVLQALHDAGWIGFGRTVVHDSTTNNKFDARNPLRKKRYLQCLLDLGTNLAANPSFRSDQPNQYYNLILNQVTVAPGLGHKQYVKILQAHRAGNAILELPAPEQAALEDQGSDDDDGIEFAGGDHIQEVPAPPKKKQKMTTLVSDIAASSSSALPKAPPPVAVPSGIPSSWGPLPDSPNEKPVEEGSGEEAMEFGESDITGWYKLPGTGAMVKLEDYSHPKHGKYKRWVCKCTVHEKDGCEKKRSVTYTASHGDIEPLAYLAAWHASPADGAQAHSRRNFPVSPEDTARWAILLKNKCDSLLGLLAK